MIVLLHLGGADVLAEVVRRGDQDRLDVRVPVLYHDGHADVLEVFGARRGAGDGQWEELPGVELPATVVEEIAAACEGPMECVEAGAPEPHLPRCIAR